MTAKNILSVTIVLFILTFYGCKEPQIEVSSFKEKHEIVVAMDMDMPGYFAIDGESFGYQHDLLQAYADNVGVELRVVNNNTPSDSEKMLNSGEVDMIAALTNNIEKNKDKILLPLYNTSFVILAENRDVKQFNADADSSLNKAFGEKTILMSSSFTTTKLFGLLLESLDNTEALVSSGNCLDMVEMLRSGECDYVICEKSEAQMGIALLGGVKLVYDFTEKTEVSIALNPKVAGLEENFSNWLAKYRTTEEYAVLNDLYFETGIVGQMIVKDSKKRLRRGISDYDHLMREVSEREGVDWRFLSAIAYHESRFKANVVSPMGARGLMQIMPVVARQFSVPQEEVMKPEVNIMLAAKLLKKIESMIKFSEHALYEDRMSILLACYNCGIGHVLDARRLATKYGYDADSWQDVSLFLQRKADPNYNNDAVVRNGRLAVSGSNQTLAFVSNVMGLYNSYRVTNRR